jgi:hypothetical protein
VGWCRVTAMAWAQPAGNRGAQGAGSWKYRYPFLESFVPMYQSELPSLRHLLIAKREHRSLRGGLER